MIKVLYFARFSDELNCSNEELELPAAINKVADLVRLLSERGQNWREVLTGPRVIVAVNQEVTDLHAAINDGDEIAFFPPVTGG